MKFQSKVHHFYPKAARGDILIKLVDTILLENGATPDNTLFGNSTCPDELNRIIESFSNYWGDNFVLGGLAGFPFTGKSGFSAFSDHVPDNGNLFILYASHMGISDTGEIGKIKRSGMRDETNCCGSTITAYQNVINKISEIHDNKFDFQQLYVQSVIEQYKEQLSDVEKPEVYLSHLIFDKIDEYLRKIMSENYRGDIYLLGGIQINTPSNEYDYFLPKVFEKINLSTQTHENYLEDLQYKIEQYFI